MSFKKKIVNWKTKLSSTGDSAQWDEPFATLQKKWKEVPAGNKRVTTGELLQLPDDKLLKTWKDIHKDASMGEAFEIRGWYHLLYKDVFQGKRILDVGSGLGIDAFTFAQHGMEITCVDIVESNLEVLKRLARLLGIDNMRFHYMKDIDSLSSLPRDYDVIWCQGSLINAPFDIVKAERQALLTHLPVGGRWIELAYPKERWMRDGKPPFERWGELTDGQGTPWMEWYDLEKLTLAFEPAKFDTILYFNYYNDSFNWFDLVRRT